MSESSEGTKAALKLRYSSVEIEGYDLEASDKDKWLVTVLRGTAFARVGEVEEALKTPGLSGENEECRGVRVSPCQPDHLPHLHSLKHRLALIIQIFLSINRPDLEKKEYEKLKKWAKVNLLQLIESTINLVTGREGYSDSSSFLHRITPNSWQTLLCLLCGYSLLEE